MYGRLGLPLFFCGKRSAVKKGLLFCLILMLGCSGLEPDKFEFDNLAVGNPGHADVVIDRHGFAVGFCNEKRQALWVIYKLEAAELKSHGINRTNRFHPDPQIPASAHPADYTQTGYDRGHLAPAADMAFSLQTMKDSFLMSNISPQLPGFNRGIWKRLEEQVRQFALKENTLYVVTGTVFYATTAVETMGKNQIPIPHAFFKVIYDMTPPEKMIGFILPHHSDRKALSCFAVTVDQVEAVTGLDFFSELPDELEERLEAEVDINLWNWSE